MESLQYYSSHNDYCFVCLNCSSEAPLLPLPSNIDEFFAGILVNILTPWMCCSCASVVQAYHESRERARRAQALLSTVMLNPQLIQNDINRFLTEWNYIKRNVSKLKNDQTTDTSQKNENFQSKQGANLCKQNTTLIKNETELEYSDSSTEIQKTTEVGNTVSSFVDVESLKHENADTSGQYTSEQCSSPKTQEDNAVYVSSYLNERAVYQKVTTAQLKTPPLRPIKADKKRKDPPLKICETDTDVTFDENDDMHMSINDYLQKKIRNRRITEEAYREWVGKTLQSEEYKKSENKCDLCAIAISHQAGYVLHLKRHKEVTPYRCHLCTQHMDSADTLHSHVYNHLYKFECLLCGEMSRERGLTVSHYFTQHERINFHCKHCSDAVFKEPMALKKHIDIWHKSQKCTVCHKIVSKTKIEQHEAAHKASLLKEVFCKLCDRRLRDRASLTAHMKVSHSESAKKEKCSLCPRMIKRSSMAAHMEKHEAKLKPLSIDERDDPTAFVCKICNRTVKSERTLEKHYRRHTFEDKKWECNDCNRIFSLKALMKSHIVRVHLKLFNIKCPQCPQTFVEKSRLTRHIATRHLKVPPRKNNMCDICGKAFSKKKSLENHRLIHTGEKPYSCEQCGRAFRQECALQTHTKIVHLGIKYKDLLASRKKRKLANTEDFGKNTEGFGD